MPDRLAVGMPKFSGAIISFYSYTCAFSIMMFETMKLQCDGWILISIKFKLL